MVPRSDRVALRVMVDSVGAVAGSVVKVGSAAKTGETGTTAVRSIEINSAARYLLIPAGFLMACS